MTGLIIKDFLCLRKALISTLSVMGFYILLTFTEVFSPEAMGGLLAVLISMLPSNCFSYDHAARWDTYARVLPISPARVVAARYLTVLLLTLAGSALSPAAGLLYAALGKMDGWGVYQTTCAVCLFVGSAINAVMLPLLYKFGAERARIIWYGVLGGAFLLGLLVVKAMAGVFTLSGLDAVSALPAIALTALPVIALALGAAILGLSYLLSLQIYKANEP